MQISTVLLPVDFSPATERELELAVEVCRAFKARLVVHHNQEAPPLGMARAWEWDGNHRAVQGKSGEVEQSLRELLARLPTDVLAEATISRGLAVPSILALAQSLPADLIVVDSHGADTDEHCSITARLIAQAPCPVLAAQEGLSDHPLRRLFAADVAAVADPPLALVPTDFSVSGARAVAYAFELARRVPLRLRLLHVRDDVAPFLPKHVDHGVAMAGPSEPTVQGAALLKLAELVPADLADITSCEVAVGAPPEQIVAACRRGGVDFLIMGEHAEGLRGLVTQDTARAVLRQAPCPIWYVPPRALA